MTDNETKAKEILEGALKQIQDLGVGIYANVADLTITLVWPQSEFVPSPFVANFKYYEQVRSQNLQSEDK